MFGIFPLADVWPTARRLALRCVVLLSAAPLLLVLNSGTAHSAKVRIKGQMALSGVQVVRGDRGLILHGSVLDDLGRGVASAQIALVRTDGSVVRETEPCRREGPPPHASNVLHAGPLGQFCATIAEEYEGTSLELRIKSTDFLEGASRVVSLTNLLATVDLDFGPRVVELDLAKREQRVRVTTRAGPRGPDRTEALPISLTLERDGRAIIIAPPQAPTAGESAVFAISTARLPGPGPGKLTATFSGTPSVAAATASAAVKIVAPATLSISSSAISGDPTAGVAVLVAAQSPQGAVPTGLVEAYRGTERVGVAEVRNGVAELTARFDPRRQQSVQLTIQYVPTEPWWYPGTPLQATVDVNSSSLWDLLPWLGALVAVAALVLRAWRRPLPNSEAQHARPPPELAPLGKPSVDVLPSSDDTEGWRGTVVDAHDGTPIAQAMVRVTVPGFKPMTTPIQQMTGAEGSFALEWPGRRVPEGSELRVDAPWHSSIVRPLPRSGRLQISLVHRRRTLLAAFESWVRRAGPPWNATSEATPQGVAARATQLGKADVARWAAHVDVGAYGKQPPTADDERALLEKQPVTTEGAERA